MNSKNEPSSPGNRASGSTLTEKFRNLTIRRKSLTPLRSTSGGDDALVAGLNIDAVTESDEINHGYELGAVSEDDYLPTLDIGNPMNERILSLRAFIRKINACPIDKLMAVWAITEDLTIETASLDARKAGFDLLISSVDHPELDLTKREKFFNMIVVPLPPALSDLQVESLKRLTKHGQNLLPFESQIVSFLNEFLEKTFGATLEARKIQQRQRSHKSNNPIGEEVGLMSLLRFIEDMIRGSPQAFHKAELTTLIDRVIDISNKTSVETDIRRVIAIFGALSNKSLIPISKLESCVEVLCAMSGMGDNPFGEDPSNCLITLLRSAYQSETLEILLKFIAINPRKRKPNVLRGAFSMLEYLLKMNGSFQLPVVELLPLLAAFKVVWSVSHKYTVDCLYLVGRLLHDKDIAAGLAQQSWGEIGIAFDDFAKLNLEPSLGFKNTEVPSQINGPSRLSRYYSHQWSKLYTDDPRLREAFQLITSAFSKIWDNLDEEKRLFIANITLILAPYADDSSLALVISYMVEKCFVLPIDEAWIKNIELLLKLALFDSSKGGALRCRALEMVKEVLIVIQQDKEYLIYFDPIGIQILRHIAYEDHLEVFYVLVDFAIGYAKVANMKVFDIVLQTLSPLLNAQGNTSPLKRTLSTSYLVVNRTTASLVKLFLQCLSRDALKTSKTYQLLIDVASDSLIPTEARLIALKLLVRIRYDSASVVKIIPMPDTHGLAAILYRTEESVTPQPTSSASLNRVSLNDNLQGSRTGRTSTISSSRSGRSRSTTRSASAKGRISKTQPPLWMYGRSDSLPEDPPPKFSPMAYTSQTKSATGFMVEMGLWMELIIEIIRKAEDWEIYSYLLVHLPSQLANIALFKSEPDHVRALHTLVISQLQVAKFHSPPPHAKAKKGDVALCLYHTLTMLVSYHDCFNRKQLDDTVKTFLAGISMWDRAAKCCIHALALCCHELPVYIDRCLYNIVQKMSQIITHTHLAMDILEFLGGLARLPEAYRSSDLDIFRTIFGICVRYLHHSWEQRQRLNTGYAHRTSIPSTRYSSTLGESPKSPELNADENNKDLPEYVFAYAHHVITYWFLTIDIQERARHVGWITKSLAWKDNIGNEVMEEQSQVTLDMMHRTAFLDLGETMPDPEFNREYGGVIKKMWLIGLSIVTIETFKDSGLAQITKRQASGTTHSTYKQHTAPLPPHHIESHPTFVPPDLIDNINILPNHILLQLTSTITPMPIPMQPIVLPDDDTTRRAIRSFDRSDTVDGHKAGVVFIAKGQTAEAEILANASGTVAYNDFLSGLGTKVCLHEATFNTQGLDRSSNTDGTHTYAWRDRVTEIIFHVTTMMPTHLGDDPECINKKRHIGNDFVNIIYNDSGLPFNFDTFKSQFNYVNIVITPEPMAVSCDLHPEPDEPSDPARTLNIPDSDYSRSSSATYSSFRVQTISFPSFPDISPASTPKIVSASVLPGFVRQLALNASLFSLIWSSREGGEHISSWRSRLREIIKLRERYANTGVSANVAYPEMGTAEDRGGARSYLEGDVWRGRLAMGGLAEENQMLLSLDFTRWA